MQSQNLQALGMPNLNVEQCLFGSGNAGSSSSSSIVGSDASSSSSSSTLIGDYIGIESCLDLTNDDDIFVSSSSSSVKESGQRFNLLGRRRDRRLATKKEFPPPIPLLARTENLPCHMPWVLRRYYTSDGRLILNEERVRHHEYFRAHRSNGRLTLHLVSLDYEVYSSHYSSEDDDNENQCDHFSNENKFEKVEENNELEVDGNEEEEEEERNELEKCCSEEDPEGKEKKEFENSLGEGETETEKEKVYNEEERKEREVNDNEGQDEEEEDYKEVVDGNDIKDDEERVASLATNGNGGNVITNFKCLEYSRMRAATCIFKMPVPAVRPIHS